MEQDEKITQLEDEIKVLKSELQSVLLDIRESYLNRENPFNPEVTAIPISPAIAISSGGGGGQVPQAAAGGAQAAAEGVITDNDEQKEAPEIGDMDDAVTTRQKKREEGEVETEETDADDESVNEQETDAGKKPAPKEVTGVRQSEAKVVSGSVSEGSTFGSNGRVDLATIAGLTQWIADTVKRLGRERTEAILDIAEIVGHMTPQLKNILVKFVNRTPDEFNGNNVTTRDYITSFIELESLLGLNSKSEEIALLSILCQEVRQ